jgi:alpha-L-arabinofuranosidase
MKKILVVLWLCICGLTVSSQSTIQLSFDFSDQGIAVSPMLYGIFFEDINYAADGGLYAELIRNRSFEESTAYWSLVKKNGSTGSMMSETQNLLNAAQSNCIKLVADTIRPGGFVGIQNTGFWGMNIVDGEPYTLTFYAKAIEGYTGAIIASLENSFGDVCYAQHRIAAIGTEWQKYTCILVADGNNETGRLSLCINAAGTVWIDVVSLFPVTFKNRSNGLRKDLAEKLDDIHPRFMRFPGGCFVEGNTMANAYLWKQTIGPIEERPGHSNFWGYRTSDGMGYHEFLQLCEDLDAEPLYVCNVGMAYNGTVSMANLNPWVQDALNAIEYANGDTATTWGRKRKENGHPEPFNMKYIEIGNENWVEPYTSHYNMFYDSIKYYYPEITTISDVNWPTLNHIEIYDDHYYSSPEWFAQNYNKYDNTSRSGAKVYVGEYAVTSGGAGNGNLRCAVGEATFMTGLEKNSDVVVMSSYAPLFGNFHGRQWNPDAIYFNSSACYGTPSYYAQKMFANNTGNKYIGAQETNNTASSADYGGAIGVATWATKCQYDSVTVISEDSVIIDDNFDDGNADGWTVNGGTWAVIDGMYTQSSTNTDCRSTCGNISLSSYTYHLKAKKTSGSEGFLIIFGYADANNFYWWNIGGWSNTLSAIEHCSGGSKGTVASVSYSVQANKWYDIRVEIHGDTAECYLDNVLFHSIVAGSKILYNSCTIDSVNHDIFLKVVNFNAGDNTADIILKNFPGEGSLKGSVETMTYATPSSENSISTPEKIVPLRESFSAADTGFQYTFPQNSINIFHLYRQSSFLQMDDATFTIPENYGNGFLAGKMTAGGVGTYSYSILTSSLKNAFEINKNTGEMTVKDSSLLNYEIVPMVVLTVSATDISADSLPPARSTCTIILSDTNEKPVLIASDYYAFANESPGASIGKIFMTDEDKNQGHFYSITAQSEPGVIEIDPATGELTNAGDADLQPLVSKTVIFSVHVADSGSPSLSDDKDYTLRILDAPLPVALPAQTTMNKIEVYPNPADKMVHIEIPEQKGSLKVNLADSRGKIVRSRKVSPGLVTMDISELPDGLYCIQVLTNNRVIGTQSLVLLK